MIGSLTLMLLLLAGDQQPSERITAIQIQGNTVTADAEIVALAGIQVGMALDASTLDNAAARLRASKQFKSVEVLKRFASIADMTQIICVIVVDEGPIKVAWDEATVGPDGRPVFGSVRKARGGRFLFLPVLDFEDGYGFSYGVRFAIPNPLGQDSLISFPATWGGDKRVGVEISQELKQPVITRVSGGAALTRRENPYFDENDDRRTLWVRGERDLGKSWRAGAGAGWDRVSFLGEHDHFTRVGADIVFDTRIDPMLARQAVYVRAAWDHFVFGQAPESNRTDLEARGYLGLPLQAVLVARALRQDSDRPLPPYLKPLLGGTANLRGLEAGSEIGDTLAAGSLELRVPLTSPLSIGKLGVSAFVDAATVYGEDERLPDQHFERGVGGGVWFSAAFVRLNLYVAHAAGHSFRVHFGSTVLF